MSSYTLITTLKVVNVRHFNGLAYHFVKWYLAYHFVKWYASGQMAHRLRGHWLHLVTYLIRAVCNQVRQNVPITRLVVFPGGRNSLASGGKEGYIGRLAGGALQPAHKQLDGTC